MLAPAVIPALVAYINTVVIKTLVVNLKTISFDLMLACSYIILCYNRVAWNEVDICGMYPHKLCLWVFMCRFLPVV